MSRLFGGAVSDEGVTKVFIPKGPSVWRIAGIAGSAEDKHENVLLVSFAIDDTEFIDPRKCFNDTAHIFSFGRNPAASSMTVSLMLFIGDACKSDSALSIGDLRKLYEEKRIYKNPNPISLQFDTFNTSGYLASMSIGTTDPQIKASVVKFHFILNEGA